MPMEAQLHPFTTSALDGGEWLAPGSGQFIPWNDPVPFAHDAGCVPGPVLTGGEKSIPH